MCYNVALGVSYVAFLVAIFDNVRIIFFVIFDRFGKDINV